MPSPEGTWTARAGEGTCLLEAGIPAGKLQCVARPAMVAFAIGRMDGAGPRLDASSAAAMGFSGAAASWSLTGLPVAPRAFGLSRRREEGGLDLVRATLPGGTFRAPLLDLHFAVPPAGHVGEAFLACVAALPAPPRPAATPPDRKQP
jgi:hypothetical protein